MTKTEVQHPQHCHDRILNIKEVCFRVGVSRAAIYRWVAAGLFLPPLKIGVNRIGWRETDIQNWIDNLSHRRDEIGSPQKKKDTPGSSSGACVAP